MEWFWILCPVFLSVFLSIKLIFFPTFKTSASKVLGFFFFLISILLLALFLVSQFSAVTEFEPVVNLFSLFFYIAIIALPPTVYIYTQHLIKYDDKQIQIAETLPHYYISFLLLIINIIAFVYFYITPDVMNSETTYLLIENVMTYSNFFALIFIFPITNIYYCYKSFLNYNKHKTIVGEVFSYENGVSLKWVKTFLIGYIIFIGLIYFVQTASFGNLLVPMSIFILGYLGFIGYWGEHQPFIQIEEEVQIEEEEKENVEKIVNVEEERTSALASSEMEDEKYLRIETKLLKYMEEEKPYLDTKLTIHQLSKLLSTNNKYLSKVINKRFNQTFVTFINSYRIIEAKKLLLDVDYNNYTIETIANLAGFHSKSVFNTSFKNLAGITPSKFKKQHMVLAID